MIDQPLLVRRMISEFVHRRQKMQSAADFDRSPLTSILWNPWQMWKSIIMNKRNEMTVKHVTACKDKRKGGIILSVSDQLQIRVRRVRQREEILMWMARNVDIALC